MLTDEQREAEISKLGGDALYLKGRWGEVILKPPAPADWEFYLAAQQNPAAKTVATHALIRSMIAYPSKDEYDALRKRYVALSEGIAKTPAFDRFIGLEVEATEK